MMCHDISRCSTNLHLFTKHLQIPQFVTKTEGCVLRQLTNHCKEGTIWRWEMQYLQKTPFWLDESNTIKLWLWVQFTEPLGRTSQNSTHPNKASHLVTWFQDQTFCCVFPGHHWEMTPCHFLVEALLPIWACFAVAFSTFVTAFAIIASTQAHLVSGGISCWDWAKDPQPIIIMRSWQYRCRTHNECWPKGQGWCTCPLAALADGMKWNEMKRIRVPWLRTETAWSFVQCWGSKAASQMDNRASQTGCLPAPVPSLPYCPSLGIHGKP